MKNVSRPIRFPEDFRETVILANIIPAALLQQHINSVCFFTIFSNQEAKGRVREAERICVSMMTTYQASGKVWQDAVLWDLNKGYLSKLIVIIEDNSLTEKAKKQKAILLLKRWENMASPLLNYPRQVMLEDGAMLTITFDYMLFLMTTNVSIRKGLTEVMSRLSIAKIHAYLYSTELHGNLYYTQFVERMEQHGSGIFLPCSDAQKEVKVGFDQAFDDLAGKMLKVKNYKKRLPVFRALVKEWYDKMVNVQ